MSKINIDEVKKVAKLSRLKITDEEASKMAIDLDNILEYASKINELNTENIEPTSHSMPLKNVLRDDVVIESLDRNKIMSNGPDVENGFYKVPKIIE
jgi:aspartyl-tRNA(Asn)/glutamyl-tRNA(Gln) amidotransferase subunit C